MMPSEQVPDDDEAWVMTVDEAARKLRISRGLVYGMAATGQLRSLRLGRRVLIPTRAVLGLINSEEGA